MCSRGRPDEDEDGIRIHAGRYSDAYLQRASWQLGYTVVMWRGRRNGQILWIAGARMITRRPR
jgi:hypothetical protein